MQRMFVFCVLMSVLSGMQPVSSQNDNTSLPNRNHKKLLKDAQKKSKQLLKEGWMPIGDKSMEEQQYELLFCQSQIRPDDTEQYVIQSAEAVDENKERALKNAQTRAKASISTLLVSKVTSQSLMVGETTNIQNDIIASNNEFETVTTVSSKNKISFRPLMSIYKKEGKCYRVLVTISVDLSR